MSFHLKFDQEMKFKSNINRKKKERCEIERRKLKIQSRLYCYLKFKCDYTNYTENQALELRIHSIVSSKLLLDDQFEI
jgi:hypothetical protein